MAPTVYLSSPGSQVHADHLRGMPVLLSYGTWKDWLSDWVPSFGRVMIDSGAYSAFNTGKQIDLAAYADWVRPWLDQVDAVAGLDDIAGDWRQSLANYEAFPMGFPTFHESDPPGLLKDLVAMAEARPWRWIGLGLIPPREGKADWVRRALEGIPPGLHVHGFALGGYTRFPRLDSVDSTSWYMKAMDFRIAMPWLTYGECLEIEIKRCQREDRVVRRKKKERGGPMTLFDRSGGLDPGREEVA